MSATRAAQQTASTSTEGARKAQCGYKSNHIREFFQKIKAQGKCATGAAWRTLQVTETPVRVRMLPATTVREWQKSSRKATSSLPDHSLLLPGLQGDGGVLMEVNVNVRN